MWPAPAMKRHSGTVSYTHLALKLHLGSMKLGNSVDIRLEATELPKIEPYAVVELEEPVYAPYVQRGNFPVLVEKITCKGIRPVPNKNM